MVKVVLVIIPSYNEKAEWILAPNFARLGGKSVQFQNAYVGSMPARRELHTGRYNFLHRTWGPLEPYDDSMPEILREKGIHAHKVTDHHHYWEDGGATYHQRYSTFDLVRGQEGDKWKGLVGGPTDLPPSAFANDESAFKVAMRKQDWINRKFMTKIQNTPQYQTFQLGLEFMERNIDKDNWFLQIETFDPHEPFFSTKEFQELYPHHWDGPDGTDWPPYRALAPTDDKNLIHHIHCMYASLITMCDQMLGRVLDFMDKHKMWDDTLLIVNTDHGFLMGEHDWWAKTIQPWFQEVAHVPLWIWDPRSKAKGEKRNNVVQMIDIPATILGFFNVNIPKDVQGCDLMPIIALDNNKMNRKGGLFGVHGGQVNVVDEKGQYIYMRGCCNKQNSPLFEYLLMPTRMNRRFTAKELLKWDKHAGFSFTKQVSVMKVPARRVLHAEQETLLFDVIDDPKQLKPIIDNIELEMKMIKLMVELMAANDSPPEQYQRLGIPSPSELTEENLRKSTVLSSSAPSKL